MQLATHYNTQKHTHTLHRHSHLTRSDIRQKMTSTPHTKNLNIKAKTRLNVLWALTNTTFGHFKEDITLEYKQYIGPKLTYAHPARQLDTKSTYVQIIQFTHFPREHQVHLSRLVCRHITGIPTYMQRIGLALNPDCPHSKCTAVAIQHFLLHCPHNKYTRTFITYPDWSNSGSALRKLWHSSGTHPSSRGPYTTQTMGLRDWVSAVAGAGTHPLSCRDSVWRHPVLFNYNSNTPDLFKITRFNCENPAHTKVI